MSKTFNFFFILIFLLPRLPFPLERWRCREDYIHLNTGRYFCTTFRIRGTNIYTVINIYPRNVYIRLILLRKFHLRLCYNNHRNILLLLNLRLYVCFPSTGTLLPLSLTLMSRCLVSYGLQWSPSFSVPSYKEILENFFIQRHLWNQNLKMDGHSTMLVSCDKTRWIKNRDPLITSSKLSRYLKPFWP